MTPEPSTPYEPAGGDGLLAIIAVAVIVVVGLEAAFIAFADWWLMVGMLLVVIVAAAVVVTALLNLMNDGTPVTLPRPRFEPDPVDVAASRRTPRTTATPVAH